MGLLCCWHHLLPVNAGKVPEAVTWLCRTREGPAPFPPSPSCLLEAAAGGHWFSGPPLLTSPMAPPWPRGVRSPGPLSPRTARVSRTGLHASQGRMAGCLG